MPSPQHHFGPYLVGVVLVFGAVFALCAVGLEQPAGQAVGNWRAAAKPPSAFNFGGIVEHAFNSPKPSMTVLLTPCCLRWQFPPMDEDGVLAACEAHRIAPAFDIGLGGRRCLRVLPSALEWFRKTGGTKRCRPDWSPIFGEIMLGHDGKPWLLGERARLILNCGSTHMIALVDDGELEVIPGHERRRGPNGSDRIKLASFGDFLKRRML